MSKNFKNKSVMAHSFSMVPRSDVPRSAFDRPHGFKTTFDSGYLVPCFVDEVLPGDTFKLEATMFARLATPIFPLMDNLRLTTFFFFVPNRLLWDNWQKFMGEQKSPGDSTDYLIPTTTSPSGGYTTNSLQDYFGLPIKVAGVEHSSLFLRAYNLIYNEWFRDENLVDPVPENTGDGPDDPADYTLLRRGKRHDYFTSCLPFAQKGDPVQLPIGNSAPVTFNSPLANILSTTAYDITGSASLGFLRGATPGSTSLDFQNALSGGASYPRNLEVVGSADVSRLNATGAVADLSSATATTINQIRQSFQIQKLLERNARGGTRYTELIRSHFGVMSPDARLQRPEYLGGTTTPINLSAVQQTSASSISGSTSPLGNLAAIGTMVAHGHKNGFTQSFTEHGVIIGLCSVQADLNYQQGLARMWSRSTRYDFYFPVFSHLGEQAVLNKEIYSQGNSADDDVFGYQERWAEYRYKNSLITGRFRSTSTDPLDAWHLAQNFSSLPALNSDFIQDKPPVDRIVAVEDSANGSQFLMDCFFQLRCVRPLPMYSVPGLVDHF